MATNSEESQKKKLSLLPLLLVLGIGFLLLNFYMSFKESMESRGLKVEYPDSFEFNNYDRLLRKYVSLGLVDYAALKKDKSLEEAYLELQKVSPEKLKGKLEQLSFWINSYNFLTIKCIADKYPIEQLRQDSATKRFMIGAKHYSLNQIKEEVFPELIQSSDWRAIFLICDGKVSSPFISPYAYTASKLENELERASKEFMLRKSNYEIDDKNKIFSISPFYRRNLKYIGDAFPSAFAMVNQYLPESERVRLDDYELNYSMPFDRRINDLALLKTVGAEAETANSESRTAESKSAESETGGSTE